MLLGKMLTPSPSNRLSIDNLLRLDFVQDHLRKLKGSSLYPTEDRGAGPSQPPVCPTRSPVCGMCGMGGWLEWVAFQAPVVKSNTRWWRPSHRLLGYCFPSASLFSAKAYYGESTYAHMYVHSRGRTHNTHTYNLRISSE